MKSTLTILRSLLKGQFWLIGVIVAANLVSAVILFLQPVFIGRLVGSYADLGNLDIRSLLGLISVFIGSSVMSALLYYGCEILSQRFTQNCQLSAGRKIFSLSAAELSAYTNGEIPARIIADTTAAKQLTNQFVLAFPSSSLLLIVIVVTCLVLDPVLSLVIFCALIVFIIITVFSGKQAVRITSEIQEQYSKLGQGIQRFASNAVFVMTNNLEKQSLQDYSASAEALFKSSRRFARLSAIISPISNMLGNLLTVAVAVVGGMRVHSGAINYQTLATVVGFLLVISRPINDVIEGATAFASAKAALTRLTPLLYLPDSTLEKQKKTPEEVSDCRLSFDSVCVRYDNTSPFVFKDLSFTLPQTGLVAVTGSSGAGKTTLALTTVGIIKPVSGHVRFGTYDLQDLDTQYVREHLVTMVLQQAPLYGRTVRDALTLGRDVDDATLKEWIDLFGLTRFLDALPYGFDTRLSDVVSEASGGEIQRLSIIRGFLRDTPVIFLDEPTSALDATNEKLVSSTIKRLAADRLVVVISHRQEPIKGADMQVTL